MTSEPNDDTMNASFDPSWLHYADPTTEGLHFLQPENAARVPISRILTPIGRDYYMDAEPSGFADDGDEFIFNSIITSSDNEEFKKRHRMFTEMAQWHSVHRDLFRDLFFLTLLSAAPDDVFWEGYPLGGVRFAFPVRFHTMPDGFAFLVHQEVFRVEVTDERDPANAGQIPKLIRDRNERLNFRTPSALAIASELQSDNAEFKSLINLIHDNTNNGGNADFWAKEYKKSPGQMRRHMTAARKAGIIRFSSQVGDDEAPDFRKFVNERTRNTRKSMESG